MLGEVCNFALKNSLVSNYVTVKREVANFAQLPLLTLNAPYHSKEI